MSYQVSSPRLPALSYISYQRSSSHFTILGLLFIRFIYIVYYISRQCNHIIPTLCFASRVGGTSTLLSSRRMEPRKVVGTVDTSEFVVALAASVGFLISPSFADIPWQVVGALLAGGLVAAPIAAWVVRHLNAQVMGTAVGGFILVTNANTFLGAVGFDPSVNIPVYVIIVAIWITALYFAIASTRRERKPVLEA
jgi:hypothetical protein